jgi:hypothetical protein
VNIDTDLTIVDEKGEKMYQNKMFLMLFVACWSCTMTMSGVAAPEGPLQSYAQSGYTSRFILYRSIKLDLSCVFQVSEIGIEDPIWTAANSAVIMTFFIKCPFPLYSIQ